MLELYYYNIVAAVLEVILRSSKKFTAFRVLKVTNHSSNQHVKNVPVILATSHSRCCWFLQLSLISFPGGSWQYAVVVICSYLFYSARAVPMLCSAPFGLKRFQEVFQLLSPHWSRRERAYKSTCLENSIASRVRIFKKKGTPKLYVYFESIWEVKKYM